MTINRELRVSPNLYPLLRPGLLDNIGTVSLGHVGCPYKLAGLKEADVEELLALGKQVKIELPVLYQSHQGLLRELWERFSTYPVNFVVNDLGTLQIINDWGLPPGLDLSAGRHLVYGFSNCPWGEDLLEQETTEVKAEWRGLSVDNEASIRFLRDMNVRWLDVDYSEGCSFSIQRLREAGFKIALFVDEAVASVSRVCYLLKTRQGIPGQCQHLCDSPIALTPKRRWNRYEGTYSDISDKTAEKLGSLKLYGNLTMRELSQTKTDLGALADNLCTTFRAGGHGESATAQVAAELPAAKVYAAQSIYSRPILGIYDVFVLWYNNRFAWKCPSELIVQHYDDNVSANHLDIGVGTGYFLDKCTFPTPDPRIVLMDINPNSLAKASARISRYVPAVYQGNALEPLDPGLGRFDSIGLSYVIHCLPGSMESKSALFENLKAVLNKGGVVFGATLLHEGVERNWQARLQMGIYNATGIFSNRADTLDGLHAVLGKLFSSYEIRIVGCAALFRASL